MIISNCVVTQSDAEVLHEFVESKSDPRYKKYKMLCVGIDLKVGQTSTTIHSLFPGTVVQIGHTSTYWSVIIAYNALHAVKYDNLLQCKVELSQQVDTDEVIGTCKKFLHFEYLNGEPSNWPVRVDATTLYKHDPTTLLTDGYASLVEYSAEIQDVTLGYASEDELTSDIAYMLSNNEFEENV